jgi:hypothetical protein
MGGYNLPSALIKVGLVFFSFLSLVWHWLFGSAERNQKKKTSSLPIKKKQNRIFPFFGFLIQLINFSHLLRNKGI